MKTRVILALVSLLAAPAFAAIEGETTGEAPRRSSSQERVVRRVIPEAGLIYSEFRGTNNQVFFGREGYDVGALFDLFGTRSIVIETGAFYRQTGATADDLFGQTKLTARYLSIPVTAKWYLGGQEGTALYLKAGVMGSNLLGSDVAKDYRGSAIDFGPDEWDVDGIAGVGLKIYLTPGTDLVLEGTYARPINSVFSGTNDFNHSFLTANAGLAVNL